jgi:hypothetical protein
VSNFGGSTRGELTVSPKSLNWLVGAVPVPGRMYRFSHVLICKMLLHTAMHILCYVLCRKRLKIEYSFETMGWVVVEVVQEVWDYLVEIGEGCKEHGVSWVAPLNGWTAATKDSSRFPVFPSSQFGLGCIRDWTSPQGRVHQPDKIIRFHALPGIMTILLVARYSSFRSAHNHFSPLAHCRQQRAHARLSTLTFI